MTSTLANGNQFIGKVKEPFTCCDPTFNIYDAKDNLTWVITGTCCQCGYACKNCCGFASEAHFGIYSPNKSDMSENNKDGDFIKHSRGIMGLVSDADTFEIIFPKEATNEDKFNLISAAILMDFLIYETSPQY